MTQFPGPPPSLHEDEIQVSPGQAVPAGSPFSLVVTSLTEHYADFGGRARRAEYWYTYLTYMLSIAVVAGLGLLIAPGVAIALIVVCGIALIVPMWAVNIRRLHDTGRSGWWMLLNFVPYAGAFILLIFTLMDSERQPNEWGPSPKYPAG